MTEHESLRESSGLYVLGALGVEERKAFEQHLATCAECAAEVRSLAALADTLPYAVPQTDPPADLRRRVLAAASGEVSRRSSTVVPMPAPRRPETQDVNTRAAWLSLVASLIVLAGMGLYSFTLRQRVGDLETELRDTITRLGRSEQQVAAATAVLQGAQIRMAVLTAPDLRQVNLAGQPRFAPRASGRAFWSRSAGLVFAAADLPALPPGRTYQLWYLQPGTGTAPVSAGLVQPDAAGSVTSAFDVQPPAAPSGLALSIEPAGGVPAPTGDLYLVGQ